MRALILAAGRGSRMRALTAHQPKCLVSVADRPLLEWQLESLRASGIHQIGVVRGYQADQVQPAYCALFENPRWAATNMVATLCRADAWLRSDACVVSYADILYHPETVTALMESRGDIALSYDRLWRGLWQERFSDPLSDAETFQSSPDGKLTAIGARASSLIEVQGQYMGLLKFTPKGWAAVTQYLDSLSDSERDRLDMTGMLSALLARKTEITTVPVDGRWCEVDSDSDLALYQSRIARSQSWTHDWRWKEAA
ncbi:MAG: phosphocholine cytidylyltransferase family protein [Verrucomicrobia bacterium]|nr:phosphocholine cytidylyltransferase family protein [Verrucomicrobiota bacterium]